MTYRLPAISRIIGTALLAAILLVVPVAAQQGGQQMSLDQTLAGWSHFNDQQKLAVIQQLIRHGRFDQADELLGRLSPVTSSARLEKRFFTGVLRRAQGQLDEAIGIFRALLTHNPQFQRVRLELAHALFLKQEDDSARHHFDLVLGSAANTDLQRTVQRFIDAMDKRRRWHLSSYFSLAPSTNINQGTGNKVVYLNGLPFRLSDASRKKSGLGVNGGVTSGYNFALTDRLDWVVGGGAHMKRYEESSYNDLVTSAEMGPRYRFGGGDVAVYATAARRWYGDQEYAKLFGGRIQTAFRLGPKDLIRAGLSCQRVIYDNVTYRNGYNCGAHIAEDHALDVRSFVRTMGGVSLERTRVDHLDYDSYHAGIGYYREVAWGVNVYAQLKYTRNNFRGNYPGGIQARHDNRFDATIHLTKRDWQIMGFAPMLQYTYTRNHSNIGFHEFDAHGLNLAWTKKF